MSIDWSPYIYRCTTKRCASYKTRIKYCNLDPEEKRAPMPRIIWDDGHNTLFNGVLAENCTGYYLATLGFNNGKKQEFKDRYRQEIR